MPGDFQEAVARFKALTEDRYLNSTRRGLYDRLDRRLREKLNPPIRDLLPARRERQQRHRRHRWANVAQRARDVITSPLRVR